MNRTSFFHRSLRATLLAAGLVLGVASTAVAAGVLERARETSKLTFGYRADARPFSFTDAGKPAGFSVALCQKVADAVRAELKLPNLQLEFVPVTATSRFELLQQGKIDLSCGTDTPTLARRGMVDFSLPIFFAGTGALLRADAEPRLRDALADRPDPVRPVWRGAPGIFGLNVVFAVVGGTTIEKALIDRLKLRRVSVTVAPVPDYAAGVQMVLDGRAAALFGDRPVLLDLAQRGAGAGQLQVIERSFTREPLALALPRGDGDFRLLVDRTLSRLYRSPEFAALYTTYFGTPTAGALEFFRAVALPD